MTLAVQSIIAGTIFTTLFYFTYIRSNSQGHIRIIQAAVSFGTFCVLYYFALSWKQVG